MLYNMMVYGNRYPVPTRRYLAYISIKKWIQHS